MGDSVSSATNAIKDAAKDTAGAVRKTYRGAINKGLREEINRGAAGVMPTAYAGNAVGIATYEFGGDIQAGINQAAGDLGIGQTVAVPDPNAGLSATAPAVADPQQKRRRQIAGRAGTLLTGGGTDGGGTNLGGAGGRSTLLGL